MNTVFITLEDWDNFKNGSIMLLYYDSAQQLKDYEGEVEYVELLKDTYDNLMSGDISGYDGIYLN